MTNFKPETGASPPASSEVALSAARDHLESALERSAAWRALLQLDERERNGDWLDVIEAGELRRILLDELATDPTYLAWRDLSLALTAPAAPATRDVVIEAPLPRFEVPDVPAPGQKMVATSPASVAPEPARRPAVVDRLPTLTPNYASVRVTRPELAVVPAPASPPHVPTPVFAEDVSLRDAETADALEGKDSAGTESGMDEAAVVIRKRTGTTVEHAPVSSARAKPSRSASLDTDVPVRQALPGQEPDAATESGLEAEVTIRRGPLRSQRAFRSNGTDTATSAPAATSDDETEKSAPSSRDEASVTILSPRAPTSSMARTAPPSRTGAEDRGDASPDQVTPRQRLLLLARRLTRARRQ